MAEKYGFIWKTDQKTQQIKHRNQFLSSKRILYRQFVSCVVPVVMATTKQGIFQQKKHENQSIRDQTSFGKELWTFQ